MFHHPRTLSLSLSSKLKSQLYHTKTKKKTSKISNVFFFFSRERPRGAWLAEHEGQWWRVVVVGVTGWTLQHELGIYLACSDLIQLYLTCHIHEVHSNYYCYYYFMSWHDTSVFINTSRGPTWCTVNVINCSIIMEVIHYFFTTRVWFHDLIKFYYKIWISKRNYMSQSIQ